MIQSTNSITHLDTEIKRETRHVLRKPCQKKNSNKISWLLVLCVSNPILFALNLFPSCFSSCNSLWFT